MTAQILQFTPHNVAAARAELVAHACKVLDNWHDYADADILTACEHLQEFGDPAEKVRARSARRRTMRIEADRQSLIAERMRDQEAAAREALTAHPGRIRWWLSVVAGSLAFVAVWWAVLVGVML